VFLAMLFVTFSWYFPNPIFFLPILFRNKTLYPKKEKEKEETKHFIRKKKKKKQNTLNLPFARHFKLSSLFVFIETT